MTLFRSGDEVVGGRSGAFAEYVCAREDRAVVLKPANVTFEPAAAVSVAALTALRRRQGADSARADGLSGEPQP